MDETEELIGLCVRALAAQMYGAPGLELHMTRYCILGLTDEPSADFNRLTLGPDPDVEDFLVRSVARARERARPLSAIMSPHVAVALAPAARRLGLRPVGTAPLMVLRAQTPVRLPEGPLRPVTITRVLGDDAVRIAGDLAAAAFDEPRDVIARCIDVAVTETAGVETWLARGDDGAMSAVTLTPTGNTAGISLMATPPQQQRQGMGRALLTWVIDDYRRRGVSRFHLGATDAGRPLYDSIGFEKVADLSA
jgi:GNAT superfamily N-acetyltransferase